MYICPDPYRWLGWKNNLVISYQINRGIHLQDVYFKLITYIIHGSRSLEASEFQTFSKPFSKTLKTFSKPQQNICVSSSCSNIGPHWGVFHTSQTFHTPCPWSVFTPITHLTLLGSQVFFKPRMKFKHFSRPWRAQSEFQTFSRFPNPVRTMIIGFCFGHILHFIRNPSFTFIMMYFNILRLNLCFCEIYFYTNATHFTRWPHKEVTRKSLKKTTPKHHTRRL